MSVFDSSAMDPETYFEQALMGMSMTDERFSLTTCPPNCKCSLCDSLNRSCRSIASTATGPDSTLSDDGDEEILCSTSSGYAGAIKTIAYYDEGEPACIVGPPCLTDSDSSPQSSLGSSRKSLDYKKARANQLKEEQENAEIRELERQLKDSQVRDRELARRKLRLEIERDGLKLMLEEAEEVSSNQRRSSLKLERIHEHVDE